MKEQTSRRGRVCKLRGKNAHPKEQTAVGKDTGVGRSPAFRGPLGRVSVGQDSHGEAGVQLGRPFGAQSDKQARGGF